jgi:N-acetylglucosaminyldiphosphoundecaprenol N-acetyl-beta-D-mannosaminyltransferase
MKVRILGIGVDSYTYASWLRQIGEWIEEGEGLHHICTVNPEFMMIAQRQPEFEHVLNAADACVADGTGVLLAAWWLGQPLPGRITGADGIYRIAERAAQKGWRLFLLGAAPGVADLAAKRLRECYRGLQIAGTHAGSPAVHEAEAIIQLVNKSQTDILLVAYGAPQQDLWINRYKNQLRVKVAMRRLGLEWLFRLMRQPWRWRRMLRLPGFVWAVLRYGAEPPGRVGKSQAC